LSFLSADYADYTNFSKNVLDRIYRIIRIFVVFSFSGRKGKRPPVKPDAIMRDVGALSAIPAYSLKAEKQGILEFMFRKLLT